MIVEDQMQLTEAVIHEMGRTQDPRVHQILESLVRHLHGFIREVRLSEAEFDAALRFVTDLGKFTTESHNETRLMAGSLGVSTLICLLNNGKTGAADTSANLLGPFWRKDSPLTPNGGSILRSQTEGTPLFFKGIVTDEAGHPIVGAEVDIWQASTIGLYENQDPEQAEMNLRGKFFTDEDGSFAFRSVKPSGYPIPTNGPVGALLAAQNRHNFRPAHIHALIYKQGFKTITSQLYSSDDPVLETDAQFGVTRALIADYVEHKGEPAPASDVTGPWVSLAHVFVLEPGEARLPTPPVSAKATLAPQRVAAPVA
jgi:catechol 1,2-dioxygenase